MILAAWLALAPSVAAAAAAGNPERALIAATDRLVRERMRATRTPGVAVTIVRHGRVLLSRGYGYADLARRRPVDPDRTLFRLASVTKLFTYTLAMQLAEAGRLDLDRDLNAYLGAGTFAATFAAPITARAVMAHRSGFEDATMYRLLQLRGEMPTAEAFVHDHVPARVRPVGEATSYSNFAVSALGLAVARIANRPYPELVAERVLAPLAMTSTAVAEPPLPGRRQPFGAMAPALASRMSLGYATVGDDVRAVPYDHIYPAAAPAGSMSSTAADMARFMAAYLNGGAINSGRILQPATVAAMRRRSYGDRPGAPDFAVGFENGTVAGRDVHWHSGAMTGFRAMLVLVPELDLGIFIAANGEAWGTKPDLVRGIVAAAFPIASSPMRAVAIRGEDYAGDYLTSRRSYTKLETLLALEGSIAHVTPAAGNRLRIDSPDGDQLWTGLTPSLFRPDAGGEDRIMFQRDASGRVIRFYAPNGIRFFERIGWAQRPGFLYTMLWLTALAAAATALAGWRESGWRHLAMLGSAILAVALPVSFVAARPAIAAADVESWPPLTILTLVGAGYLGFAALATAIAAAVGATSMARRGALAAMALALGGALYALSRWGLFGPVFN
ncbi:serine hydrolase domain-containing protein [Sphingomonas sp. DT-204]|uniref:serine hydrolase domain-containing protein n=1 Tax=Sphingomonas sp. DT-204 TaxID=3396166 RepID=UPI003F1DF353